MWAVRRAMATFSGRRYTAKVPRACTHKFRRSEVRFRGQTGLNALSPILSAFDPWQTSAAPLRPKGRYRTSRGSCTLGHPKPVLSEGKPRDMHPPQTGTITLVHGTWARGFLPKWLDVRPLLGSPQPLWFENKSRFREELEPSLKGESLDYGIRPFCWSGANSVFARCVAARNLATMLQVDLGQSSNATPIVIAHSHGANVALRAMTHLGADASRVRIVT